MTQRSALDILEERGLVEQTTDETALRELLRQPGVSIYVGFDPTADSLHVGHLLPLMALAHLQRAGHRPIAVVGGGTGMIGDPSGRGSERRLLTLEAVRENAEHMKRQMQRIIRFEGENAALMVNNYDWLSTFSYIDWLREVGKHFSVNAMIAKESVRRRLEDRDHGISYTEFSYMLLQAYDFLHLFDHQSCLVQAGGRDQWGNITAGIDLIRRTRGAEAYGLTFPLVMSAGGEKFGKSLGNAVWLDAGQTSPYHFYQYWVRCDDRDVESHLKFFTFLDIDEITGIVERHGAEPEKRLAQRVLAEEVTRIVHGEEEARRALRASQALFGGELTDMTDAILLDIFADVPSTQRRFIELDEGIQLVQLLADTGLCKSKGEARRLIGGGGVYLNNVAVDDINLILGRAHLATESILILRAGKKNYHLVRFS